MTEKEEKLAAIAANLDETQIVSLQDLEELERLQIADAGKNIPGARRQKAVPLSAVLGLVAALALTIILAAVLLHSRAQTMPAHAAVAGSR